MNTPVAVHPESVPEHPDTVRWIIPAGTLGFAGPIAAMPSALDALLRDGTIASMEIESAAVVIRLATGRSWRTDGARVRRALQIALQEPAQWHPVVDSGPDDLIRAAALEVLAGDVGTYVASHGGVMTIVDVSDGIVTVDFAGACAHCPASDETLTTRFADAVRARTPGLRGVRTTDTAAAVTAGRKLLRLLPTRA